MLGRRVGRRIGSRRVCRDRSVVDDPSAARRLAFHLPEGRLHAQEHAGEVDIDDVFPLLERQVLERYAGRVDARVVEQHVDSAERTLRFSEQRVHRRWIGDVRRHGQRISRCAFRGRSGLFQRIAPAPGKRNAITMLQKRERGGLADAAACAGDDCNFGRGHAFAPADVWPVILALAALDEYSFASPREMRFSSPRRRNESQG